MTPPNFDPKRTALLVIDVQHDYCSPGGAFADALSYTMNAAAKMVEKLPSFIDSVRSAGGKVVFVRMIEDPDYMLPNAGVKINSFENPLVMCTPNTKGFEYYGISPKKGDIQIIKNSYGAFISKQEQELLKKKGIETRLLQDVLQENHIECLLFSGVVTSRCVDTSVRAAFQHGYTCIVAEDLVSAPDQLMFEHDAALNVWRCCFAYVFPASKIQPAN